MPDLEMLLQDIRPVPEPAWAAKLDTRVAQRFPGSEPRRQRALAWLRDHVFAIGAWSTFATAMIAVIIIGVTHDGPTAVDSMSSSGSAKAPAMARPAAGTADSASGSSTSGSSIAPTSTDGRVQRKEASLTLTTPAANVDSVTDHAIRITDSLDGFVKSSSTDTSGSNAEANLTLQVPTARLDDALAQLSKLAHVKARSQQSEDLTDQKAALEASVRDARADVTGLRARLAKAGTDKERASLRAKLDVASRRVTRAEREVAGLGREVSYATIDLTIRGTHKSGAAPVKPGGKWTPRDALHDAGRVLEVIAGVLVIALAILVPLGLIGLLIWLAMRIFTRHARERALEMA